MKGVHRGHVKVSAGGSRKGDTANTTRKPPPVKAGAKSMPASTPKGK